VTDLIYGPQTPAVQALISRASRLTPDEVTALAVAGAADWVAGSAAWNAAINAVAAARDVGAAWAAGSAAWNAAMDAVAAAGASVSAARDAVAAAGDAALALVVRGLISEDHYRILTGPWARVVGRVHPDDPDRRGSLDA
jgi:hypothetical protein